METTKCIETKVHPETLSSASITHKMPKLIPTYPSKIIKHLKTSPLTPHRSLQSRTPPLPPRVTD